MARPASYSITKHTASVFSQCRGTGSAGGTQRQMQSTASTWGCSSPLGGARASISLCGSTTPATSPTGRPTIIHTQSISLLQLLIQCVELSIMLKYVSVSSLTQSRSYVIYNKYIYIYYIYDLYICETVFALSSLK